MPRLADHEERRRQITDAARRVVAGGGIPAATFQAVAAEAGTSVRLVQYYFGHKEGLLAATHRAVIEDTARRFPAGPPASSPGPGEAAGSVRDVLRGILVALLPLDDAQRADAVVLAAFHADALTRADVAPDALLGAPRALVDAVAGELRRAQGGPPEDEGARTDAELLLATASGLTQGLVAGHHSRASALAVVDRLLDRLLAPAP